MTDSYKNKSKNAMAAKIVRSYNSNLSVADVFYLIKNKVLFKSTNKQFLIKVQEDLAAEGIESVISIFV